jgi:hypothetical protein
MQFEPTQPPVHTKPLGQPRQWQAVIDAAAGICQCAGACGNQHTRTGLRCDAAQDAYRKGSGWIRLIAAPADLTLPALQAAAVPTDQLKAWCPKCYQGARRRQRAHDAERQRRQAAPEGLFELEELS